MMKFRWKKTAWALCAVVLAVSVVSGGTSYGEEQSKTDPAKTVTPATDGESQTAAGKGPEVKIAAATPGPLPGSERVASSGKLTLDFNPKTAEIQVTDSASGTVWSSNPADIAEDKIAKGVKKIDLQSQLIINYVDPQLKPFQLNSFTGSVKDQKFAWKKIDGGVEIVFEFPKAEITVPVRYTLKGDAFSAEIVTEGMKQGTKYKLVDISLLPFFGAGNLKDEGYLFVPDGSGALIRFNNNKSSYKSYNDRVYGSDKALSVAHRTEVKEDIKLPVFGLQKNGSAFLGVIHQGAYQGGISAEVSRKSNQYNSVYSTFSATENESNLIMEGTANEKQVVRMSESLAGSTPYEVKYYFLSGNQASYTGMAARYRQYLTEELGVPKIASSGSKQIPLLLDFLGGVEKRKTFLGIPYHTVEPLTSYDEVGEAVSRLQEKGVSSLSVRYEGWMSGGIDSEIPTSVSPESNLGGKKKFNRLVKELDEKKVDFYPVVNPVEFFEGGNGFNKFFDVAKGISRGPALQYDFRLSDGTKNPKVSPWYLLKPESVKEALGKFSQAANKKGLTHIAFGTIGSTLYSDFRKNSLSKNSVGQMWQEGLKGAQEQVNRLMFDNASAYTFPYASSLNDVPLFASGYDVEDEAVPFYSIAVSGLMPAFSEPVNLTSEPSRYVLKLLETGTYPSYRLIAADSEHLHGTRYDSLYSAEFGLWFDKIVADYGTLNKALAEVAGREIVGHEQLQQGVYRTSYAGGTSVIVNYTDSAVSVGTDRIAAGSYAIR